jgi:hypothetical protein
MNFEWGFAVQATLALAQILVFWGLFTAQRAGSRHVRRPPQRRSRENPAANPMWDAWIDEAPG